MWPQGLWQEVCVGMNYACWPSQKACNTCTVYYSHSVNLCQISVQFTYNLITIMTRASYFNDLFQIWHECKLQYVPVSCMSSSNQFTGCFFSRSMFTKGYLKLICIQKEGGSPADREQYLSKQTGKRKTYWQNWDPRSVAVKFGFSYQETSGPMVPLH